MFVWLIGYSPVPLNKRRTLVVAISGCDTGFGRSTAEALAQEDGFIVVAGCLRSESVGELKAMGLPNLKPALLDVTSDASVAAFVKEVEAAVAEKQDRSLHCVINNAGVVSGGAVDWLKMENFQFDMEVNYFGMIRFTKACLPLLKAAAKKRFHSSGVAESFPPPPCVAPRIVNVTSVAGLIPCCFLSPYNSSKHAAEAFTACLRMELKSWGIKVSTCNPTFHSTPMVANSPDTMARSWKTADPATKAEYGEAYFAHVNHHTQDMIHRHCWDAKHVVDTLRSAVTLTRPRSQYLVGSDARMVFPLLRQLPSWLIENLVVLLALKLVPPLAASIPPAGPPPPAAAASARGEASSAPSAHGEPKKDL